MIKNISKIINALTLSASDTREETIKSIILNTLFECKDPVDQKELKESINIIYDIELYESEEKHILSELKNEQRIILKEGKYCISEEESSRHSQIDIFSKDKAKKRFDNFKTFITENIDSEVTETSVQKLWEAFSHYLYSAFYDYGEKASSIFLPNHGNEIEQSNGQDRLKEALKMIQSQELKEDFKKIIKIFPDYLSTEDLDFINSLGQKTLAFASLGVEPHLAKELEEMNLVDWTIYLDTNFLFSLLDLHSHAENEACKAFVQLVNENKMNIKIRYSNVTGKELKNKKSDFEHINSNISKSAIKGMLKSNQLDDFSQHFYNELLNKPDSTLHPSKVIEISQTVLDKENIKLSQNKARIEGLGEEFLNIKIQDYLNYVKLKNESRAEFKQKHGNEFHSYYRSDRQAEHDITLREIIASLRGRPSDDKPMTLNNVKYFCLTLDHLLISYDRYEFQKRPELKEYPIFFKPSYLLNRLVKTLPIKVVDDHKKAFIKAVTSRGFNQDIAKTSDILKFVNYLKERGIDDEEIISNLVSEEIFLTNYSKYDDKGDSNLDEFIESEINKVIKQKQSELEKFQKELEALKDKYSGTLEAKEDAIVQIQKVEHERDQKAVEAENLEKAVKILGKRLSKIEKSQISPPTSTNKEIDFEGAKKEKLIIERDEQIEELQEKISDYEQNELQRFITKRVAKWQILGYASILVVLIFLAFFVFMFWFQDWKYNYVTKLISWIESLSEIRKENFKILFGFLFAGVQGISWHLIYKRLFKRKAKEDLMKELLDEYNSI